jgi:hypothetical protein
MLFCDMCPSFIREPNGDATLSNNAVNHTTPSFLFTNGRKRFLQIMTSYVVVISHECGHFKICLTCFIWYNQSSRRLFYLSITLAVFVAEVIRNQSKLF